MTPETVERGLPEGPKSDSSFRRKMRMHQSCWREAQGLDYAASKQGGGYGNLLSDTDGGAGKNFYSEAIFHVVKDRIDAGPGVEPNRCKCNLLSSQPMAFNLFAPLCLDSQLAIALLNPVLPGGVRAAKVYFEYSPGPDAADPANDRSYRPHLSYLGDHTSFDVAINYITLSGDNAFAGIEVKLSEPFSPKRYGIDDRYADHWADQDVWNKRPTIDPTAPALNQIWRTHMLAQAHHRAGNVKAATAVVLHHSGDSNCAKAVKNYLCLLSPRPDATLFHWTIGKLTEEWAEILLGRPELDRGWLEWFMKRYPDPL